MIVQKVFSVITVLNSAEKARVVDIRPKLFKHHYLKAESCFELQNKKRKYQSVLNSGVFGGTNGNSS